MRIVRNNIIPIKGFKAINLFGILFVRKNANIDEVTLNHEAIHTAQMKELLYVFFYLWYIVEWIIKLFYYRNNDDVYRNISFEREAYDKQRYLNYLTTRKLFAFINYLK
jgi:hypothetical protein